MIKLESHNPDVQESKGTHESIKALYRAADLARPPFRYPQLEEDYEPQALHPTMDETKMFELEYRVFETIFPPPEEVLKPTVGTESYPMQHLQKTYTKYLRAKADLDENITDAQKTQEAIIQIEKMGAVGKYIKTIRESIGKAIFALAEVISGIYTQAPDEKDLMWLHVTKKQLFLQWQIAYLYNIVNCGLIHTPQAKKLAQEKLHEAELTLIAHMTFTLVRSTTNEYSPTRRDRKTLVMDHVYKGTTLPLLNAYLDEIERWDEKENDVEKKEIYEELNVMIVCGIGHDYLEDFDGLTERYFINSLSAKMRQDGRSEVAIQKPTFPGTPGDTNFITKNEDRILDILNALNKWTGENFPTRIANAKPENKILATTAKATDKTHNLLTLDHDEISIRGQANQITSVTNILNTGIHLFDTQEFPYPKHQRRILIKVLSVLAKIATEQANRLLTSEKTTLEELGRFEQMSKLKEYLQAQAQNLQTLVEQS